MSAVIPGCVGVVSWSAAAALEREVKEVCGEESVDSYQEVEASLQQRIDAASE